MYDSSTILSRIDAAYEFALALHFARGTHTHVDMLLRADPDPARWSVDSRPVHADDPPSWARCVRVTLA